MHVGLGSARTPEPAHSPAAAPRRKSVRVFAQEHNRDGRGDDAQVEPQRPVADVRHVVFHAIRHFSEGVGFSTEAVHLCPSRDPRFDVLTLCIAVNQRAIEVIVLYRVWTWANDGHRAHDYVEELGQLIKAKSSDKPAKTRRSRIVVFALRNDPIGFGVHAHGSKLPHLNGFAADAEPALFEQDWPW